MGMDFAPTGGVDGSPYSPVRDNLSTLTDPDSMEPKNANFFVRFFILRDDAHYNQRRAY